MLLIRISFFPVFGLTARPGIKINSSYGPTSLSSYRTIMMAFSQDGWYCGSPLLSLLRADSCMFSKG